MSEIILVISIAMVSLLYSLFVFVSIIGGKEAMPQKVQEIGDAIKEGAITYLNRQYTTISLVGLVIAMIVWFTLGFWSVIAFIAGAKLSALAGYIGMHISIRANSKTTMAATKSLERAFFVAYHSGSSVGFLVVSFGLIGVIGCFIFATNFFDIEGAAKLFMSFSLGASLVSVFARLGGGIFTKGADVGSDLAGKLDAGIPEDDPRNPGVIADNVGDNVGDCAGMSADLFETQVVTICASVLMGMSFYENTYQMMIYPIVVAAVCLAGSMFGSMMVRLKGENIMYAMYKGLLSTMVISGAFVWLATSYFFAGYDMQLHALFSCVISGFVVTIAIIVITDYYTSYHHRPVKGIARASQTGHATNIIEGLAVSMEATIVPIIVIACAILFAYFQHGLYGIAISATGMLSLAATIMTLDMYGPITDNAGGIAEMAGLDDAVRTRTDALDAIGNTTKAFTKGYAICSAGLCVLVLFNEYQNTLQHLMGVSAEKSKISLDNPYVLVGLLLGAAIPYAFSAFSMRAVGNAGQAIVVEIRRQFKEIKGIMDGTGKPDYSAAVDILTKSALKSMVVPSLLPVVSPIVLYLLVRLLADPLVAAQSVGAMLFGAILVGIFMALSMTSGGGAWDNAKKYIELGNFGGKNSEAHKAAVTGDTVGDPYKDTAGPAINPMIKVINIVAILLLYTMKV